MENNFVCLGLTQDPTVMTNSYTFFIYEISESCGFSEVTAQTSDIEYISFIILEEYFCD